MIIFKAVAENDTNWEVAFFTSLLEAKEWLKHKKDFEGLDEHSIFMLLAEIIEEF
jgi:hypothetical protein